MLGRARSPRGSCSIVVNPWALDQGGADDRGFGREGSGLAKHNWGQMHQRNRGRFDAGESGNRGSCGLVFQLGGISEPE